MAWKAGDVFVCDACLSEFTLKKAPGGTEGPPRCFFGEPIRMESG
jgi:hypothetical protein